MNVSLIWITPDAERMVAHIARVSNPANQDNPDYEKLLRYMIEHKHWSPFEMASACVELNTTRDIGRQVLRHRSFSFQEFCVAGDTEVTLVSESANMIKRSIETLYGYQNDPRMQAIWDRGVRVYDEASKTFIRSRIKEVFRTGMKACFKVTLEDGKQITCTDQHRFFTRDGFARLGDLVVGSVVAVNGEACYRSLDWMTQAKRDSLFAGGGVSAPFRMKVWQWQAKHKHALLAKHNNICVKCGSKDQLEIDHIVPVSVDETLAFDLGNLQILCAPCHREKSVRESVAARQTVRWKRIVSIESVGEVMTYDLEVEHSSHNYVANGIVTHNSQRYASTNALPEPELREARIQDTKNRQNSIEVGPGPLADRWEILQHEVYDAAEERYREALALGIAKEQARALLPEGLTPTRMYMAGTLRSFLHHLQLRTGPETQKEHRLIAQQIAEVLRAEVPTILKAAGL